MPRAKAKAGRSKRAPKKTAAKRPPPKKTAKKAAKKAARVKGGAAPAAQANQLATLKQAHPGLTSEQLAELYNMAPEDVLKRRAFIHEYLKDFSLSNAALRMGYPEETAWSTGRLLLYHAYTQLRLSEILATMEGEALVNAAQIVAGLLKEANAPDVAYSSNSATRIAAWRELAKIKKLTGPQTNGKTPANNGHGGVMLVPIAVSPSEWENYARESQERLKESVMIDI